MRIHVTTTKTNVFTDRISDWCRCIVGWGTKSQCRPARRERDEGYPSPCSERTVRGQESTRIGDGLGWHRQWLENGKNHSTLYNWSSRMRSARLRPCLPRIRASRKLAALLRICKRFGHSHGCAKQGECNRFSVYLSFFSPSFLNNGCCLAAGITFLDVWLMKRN